MNGNERYRDWGILNFWFRAVEKYAPWVRKIHFVTCGQCPKWLNIHHPKLHFVKHEDYIPHQWLPTFSANPIELNMHRIEGLAEKFVYFNDDVFLNAPVKPEDFFVNGLPCSCAALNPGPYGMTNSRMKDFAHMPLNDIIIISEHFNFGQSFKQNMRKWITLRYGAKPLIKTLLLLPFWRFTGFHEAHTANAFLKSTFVKIWELEQEKLEQTSSHKFRDTSDVNQWLMEDWQIAEGNFYPRDLSAVKGYIYSDKPEDMARDIRRKKYKLLCFNDISFFDTSSSAEFETFAGKIRQAYAEVLPEKSSFEL